MNDPFLSLERRQVAQAEAVLRGNPQLREELAARLRGGNSAPRIGSHLPESTATGGRASIGDGVILPSADITIKDTAEALFKRIGPTNTMFIRGGAVTCIVEHSDAPSFEVVSAAAARSRFESYARLLVYRAGRDGQPGLKPAVIAQEMAAALLETEEARTFLPHITGLTNCPVILNIDGDVRTLGKGFHSEAGLYVTDGCEPENLGLSDAKAALQELVREFDFQSPGDRSRALASFITPALKLGGHLKGNVPAAVDEADRSQAGKTYRQKLVAAIYNERPSLVTFRSGGVGSVDESLNAKLLAGRPFIQLDNFRGKFNSPHVEALLTAEKSFPVRVPHSREVVIDPSRFFVMLTSNGVDTTRDLANRASIVRIRKREGHLFTEYPEGDLLDHVRARQPYYLGAVFAIVREWIQQGRLRSRETRHDFREWAQMLDWIVQNLLSEAPLMDGHQAAQERVCNPDLTFVRNLALAVAEHGGLGKSLKAADLYGISQRAGVEVPGLGAPDEEKGRQAIGTIMRRVFKASPVITVEGYGVTRWETESGRSDGGGAYPGKEYVFERADA